MTVSVEPPPQTEFGDHELAWFESDLDSTMDPPLPRKERPARNVPVRPVGIWARMRLMLGV